MHLCTTCSSENSRKIEVGDVNIIASRPVPDAELQLDMGVRLTNVRIWDSIAVDSKTRSPFVSKISFVTNKIGHATQVAGNTTRQYYDARVVLDTVREYLRHSETHLIFSFAPACCT